MSTYKVGMHAVYTLECSGCGHYAEFDSQGEPYDGAASDRADHSLKQHTCWSLDDDMPAAAVYLRWED